MDWAGLIIGVIAAAAPIAVFLYSVRRDRHPLYLIERLSVLTERMNTGGAREMAGSYRDDLLVKWVLEQRARPVGQRWQRWRNRSWRLGGVLFTLCILSLAFAWGPVWTAALYVVALVAIGLGTLSGEARRAARQEWVEQELAWRGLARPWVAQDVRHPSQNALTLWWRLALRQASSW